MPFICCRILSTSLHLCEPQFSHLYNGNTKVIVNVKWMNVGNGLSTMPGTQSLLKCSVWIVATAAVTASESNHQREKSWRKYVKSIKVYPLTWFWEARKSPSYWFWPLNMGPIASLEAGVSSSWARKGLLLLWEGKHTQPSKWEEETQSALCAPTSCDGQPTARVTAVSQTLTAHCSLPSTQAQGSSREDRKLVYPGQTASECIFQKDCSRKTPLWASI